MYYELFKRESSIRVIWKAVDVKSAKNGESIINFVQYADIKIKNSLFFVLIQIVSIDFQMRK